MPKKGDNYIHPSYCFESKDYDKREKIITRGVPYSEGLFELNGEPVSIYAHVNSEGKVNWFYDELSLDHKRYGASEIPTFTYKGEQKRLDLETFSMMKAWLKL